MISDPGLSTPLTILYRDEHLVAVDKPPGLLVHRTKLDARERRFAMQLLRDQIGHRVWPIHRLDKPTSGVLLFATDSDIARTLSDQFAERTVQKEYAAIVRGWTDDTGRIDYALQEILDKTTDRKARADKPAQEAVTTFFTEARCEVPVAVGRYDTARYSWVRIIPETGRKNQIRRHFKHIFHPILGDRKFGDRAHNAFLREQLEIERMILAATSLTFSHPVSGLEIRIQAADGFPEVVRNLFRDYPALQ